MRKILAILLIILATAPIYAQSCYSTKSTQGTKLFKLGRYSEARTLFVEAQECPDRPKSGKEMEFWIKQCDEKLKEQKSNSASNQSSSTSGSSSYNSTKPSSSNTSSRKATYLYTETSSISFDSDGGTKTYKVSCNGDWEISGKTYVWLSARKSGQNLVVDVRENTDSKDRSDYFYLKSGGLTYRIDVKQSYKEQAYLSVSQNNISTGKNGGQARINVNCNGSWQVSVRPLSWVHLTKYNDYLDLSIDPNPYSSERTDYFVLSSGDIKCKVNIRQEGEPPYLTASSTSINFDRKGGTDKIYISSNANWEVYVKPAYWVHLTREGSMLTINVLENPNTEKREDYFVLDANGKRLRIVITQKANHSFFKEEEGFATNFLNVQAGYNLKTKEQLYGMSYSFVKSHLGFRLSGFYGLNHSYAATIEPVFRLTNDNSALDLQLYFGGGIYNAKPVGSAGLRFAWRMPHDFSLWDFSLGCMGTLDGDIVPTVSTGVAIPVAPLVGLGALLSESPITEHQSSLAYHFLDCSMSFDPNINFSYAGLSYSYVPSHIGWYGSAIVDADFDNLGGITGPVIRFSNSYSIIDFQIYGGVGVYNKLLAYEAGMRFALPTIRYISWWDMTLGITGINQQIYYTLGASLGVSSIAAIAYKVIEYYNQ